MYSYIKGTLEEVAEGQIVVDHQGIGYQIQVSGNLTDLLPPVGREVKIYTYLNVKEDSVTLFGFLSGDDLEIFRMLLKVNGIGPKGALGILSALSTEELRFAVLSGDAKAIAKAPGIGAKSAQRIILELKDKMKIEDILDTGTDSAGKGAPASFDAGKNEAVQALTALGYSSSEALSAIAKTQLPEDASAEDVLKAALKQMAFL